MSDLVWETPQLLFVYGSLLVPVGDPRVDEAMSWAQDLGLGHIHGRLYDLGAYPGALPLGNPAPGEIGAPSLVAGRLKGISDPDQFFAVLDEYEGFDGRKPLESEFVRATAQVLMAESGRVVMAQVYFYNKSIAGKTWIASGDYLAFKRAKNGGRG